MNADSVKPTPREASLAVGIVGGLVYATDGNGDKWLIPLGTHACRPGLPAQTLTRVQDIPRPLHVTEVMVIEDAG